MKNHKDDLGAVRSLFDKRLKELYSLVWGTEASGVYC